MYHCASQLSGFTQSPVVLLLFTSSYLRLGNVALIGRWLWAIVPPTKMSSQTWAAVSKGTPSLLADVWYTLLRANVRVLAVVVAVAAVAASNALLVPLRLEHQIEVHPRSPGILAAHRAGEFTAVERDPWRLQGPLEGLDVAYRQKGCDNVELLQRCGGSWMLILVVVASHAVSLAIEQGLVPCVGRNLVRVKHIA